MNITYIFEHSKLFENMTKGCSREPLICFRASEYSPKLYHKILRRENIDSFQLESQNDPRLIDMISFLSMFE